MCQVIKDREAHGSGAGVQMSQLCPGDVADMLVTAESKQAAFDRCT